MLINTANNLARTTLKSLPFSRAFGRGATSTIASKRFLAIASADHEWPNMRPSLNNSSGASGGNSAGVKVLALATSMAAAQHFLGEKEEFFDHRFITDKHPDDLADFYGTEAFMDVFCVLPFMARFMMRGGEFDDEGHIHTFGLAGPGNLVVSIDFDEVEEDTTGDGVADTISWFNKRESFHDASPIGNFTLWKMTQNFGYHRLHDGRCEVYHNGEYFRGLFPIRLLFEIHAAYVAWATERFINSDEFGSEELEDEAEIYRQNIPKQVFHDFILSLTQEVQSLKDAETAKGASGDELDATIEKLKELSKDDRKTNLAHFTTLRRHNSSFTKLKLVVDDAEMQQTIGKALKQVGESKGKAAPVDAVNNLQRRATKAQIEAETK